MRKIPGDTLPKGMKIPAQELENEVKQEVEFITLKDANYVADIREAIENLPYDVEIEELVVKEARNEFPIVQMLLTIHSK
ncbi:hypothetical protein TthWC1_2571 [Thermoanaerobacter thermohydrosulfuricus WC1]|jgi:hypothetical protein|uniref:Uncharacterized protein n=2 Tax=Thermoanaerobacter TaxID=1754 RepID=D3T347_THEIA|nr:MULTISPECIES: hypothetical protein [Thermoanaerobacter]ADD02649.1 hypothetical protein Thit_1390 [Thermoanaerobacter italicus Ab9]EMT37951.1 hypothetical protein TthWC1_2571 [Thermoanaerobacter thermohydrosulfuricus WC1]